MTDGYSVDGEALRQDAAQFEQWGSAFEAIGAAIPDLAEAQVSTVPGAAALLEAYGLAVAALRDLAATETAECESFAGRLRDSARIYAGAADASEQDVATVNDEMESL